MRQRRQFFQSGRWTAGLLIYASLAVAGCQRGNEFVKPPPPQVTVATPIERDVVDTIEFTGTTRATARVEIRSQVSGKLERIEFEDGATVEEGARLFVIEQAPFQASLLAAEAQRKKAMASRTLAETTVRRADMLFKQSAGTESDLELAQAQLETAAAEVAAAEAAVTQADLQLSYTEIRSPIRGRISRHLIDVGNLITAQTSQLATVESIAPIHAYFTVSERDLLRFMEMLRNNQLPDPETHPPLLYLGIGNEQGFPHRGFLDYREFGVDPGTGTIVRRGEFENPDGILIPGLFVRIQAPIGEPQPHLLVEERAIGADQRGDYVLIVDAKNIVEYRRVELGPRVGGLRIIKSGVDKSDRVVINGLQRARPSAEVNPQMSTMSETAAADEPTTDANVAETSNEEPPVAADNPPSQVASPTPATELPSSPAPAAASAARGPVDAPAADGESRSE